MSSVLTMPFDAGMAEIQLLFAAISVSFTALMSGVNPIGTAIILLSLTQGTDPKVRRQMVGG